MLTADQSIVVYDRGQALPDRLTRVTHRHYLDYAGRMLAVYRSGVGSTRRELHRSIQNVLAQEPDCPRRRIDAFCKLLDDESEFDTDKKGQAAALRLQVFTMAARYHPLVTQADRIFERGEAETKKRIAHEIGRPWEEIDRGLYVDVIDRQPLLKFAGFDSPQALLSRYNLAQLQACLYKAQKMVVHASTDFAAVVRYAKLCRLLVEAWRVSEKQYRIELSGPASVLHETRRYGVNFARFVAVLAACRNWQMRAVLTTPWNTHAELRVTSDDGYRSHIPAPAEFDSDVEEAFFKKWGDAPRDGWRLFRDAGILQHGQTTFVPDFLLKHEDGREVYLEVVGFWTPEYLEAKRKTIRKFSNGHIVLAVPERTVKPTAADAGLVIYKTRIKPEDVVKAVAALQF